MNDSQPIKGESAWNPGLESSIPARLMPMSTIFRPENSFIDYSQAREIAEFCGLEPFDVIQFRPERLIVHELLIRVTADLHVPDGPNYEDLGISLRGMVKTIYDNHMNSRLSELAAVYEQVVEDAKAKIAGELEPLFPARTPPPAPAKKSVLKRLFGGGNSPQPIASQPPGELDVLDGWSARLKTERDTFTRSCLHALIKVVGSIYGKRGRLVGDADTVRDVAARMVGNAIGSERIGEALDPAFRDAAAAEDYTFLPAQTEPVIMNVKGASAAGKSTIRQDQMRLARKLNVPWEDFAVISPDYWRKYLIDYDSLGDDYKYAAMLTGKELEMIDVKLDRYMAAKAARDEISHLLIDRFRFDSFLLEHERAADSNLLTRFGKLVFLFFVITSPEATVERAYRRGIATGRYKAVDDLLYHNVEAYTGMPDLFFSWASAEGKRIHFEFLDNNVAIEERPRTVAFGWNQDMVVLDVQVMLQIDRYRKVNVDAKRPSDVLDDASAPAAENTRFLERCARLIHSITFADGDTGRVYGRMEHGKWVWRDDVYLRELAGDADWVEGLRAIGWDEAADAPPPPPDAMDPSAEKAYTIGLWAPAFSAAVTDNGR